MKNTSLIFTNVNVIKRGNQVLGIWEFSILSSEFFCKSKTVQKLKVSFKKINPQLGKKILQNIHKGKGPISRIYKKKSTKLSKTNDPKFLMAYVLIANNI